MTLEVRIGADGRFYKPSGSLASSGFATLSLERAIVTLTSGKLVMRDTITPEGSRLSKEPAYLNPSPAYAQSLLLRYELKPDRAWTATVQVFDEQDSIRYTGSLTIDDMDAYEYLDGCLPVDPRYAGYETRLRLPAKIETDGVPMSGRGLRALYFDRLELLVNGNVVMERLPGFSPTGVPDQRTLFADTALLYGSEGKRFFRPSDIYADAPITLSYDYVSLSANRFEVATYGYLQGDTVGVTPERMLYKGEREVNISSAKVSVEDPIEMVWQAVEAVPSGATATGMTVRLGRAGKVVMNVVVPGEIAL